MDKANSVEVSFDTFSKSFNGFQVYLLKIYISCLLIRLYHFIADTLTFIMFILDRSVRCVLFWEGSERWEERGGGGVS